MNVKNLRKNKMKAVAMLRKKGVSVRQISVLLYGDDSESAQKRVAVLISKLRKKSVSIARSQPQPSGHQPQPQLLNPKNTVFAPQPQPQKANNSKDDSTITGDKMVGEEHEAQEIKQPEMVEKGKADRQRMGLYRHAAERQGSNTARKTINSKVLLTIIVFIVNRNCQSLIMPTFVRRYSTWFI